MTIYRRKLPHLERDGGSCFITFKARDDLSLNDDAKWLVLDHCLYDDGKRYELESVVVMSTHVHLILTPLPDGLGFPVGNNHECHQGSIITQRQQALEEKRFALD
ncbi:MAG TPA: hypothetical protein VE783_02120 [Candidatus Limnocylindrales bacterium]|jgi:hypothetical protein|nr:hypothetical protein [Candidatus Limnocylindrales bacterium]